MKILFTAPKVKSYDFRRPRIAAHGHVVSLTHCHDSCPNADWFFLFVSSGLRRKFNIRKSRVSIVQGFTQFTRSFQWFNDSMTTKNQHQISTNQRINKILLSQKKTRHWIIDSCKLNQWSMDLWIYEHMNLWFILISRFPAANLVTCRMDQWHIIAACPCYW